MVVFIEAGHKAIWIAVNCKSAIEKTSLTTALKQLCHRSTAQLLPWFQPNVLLWCYMYIYTIIWLVTILNKFGILSDIYAWLRMLVCYGNTLLITGSFRWLLMTMNLWRYTNLLSTWYCLHLWKGSWHPKVRLMRWLFWELVIKCVLVFMHVQLS